MLFVELLDDQAADFLQRRENTFSISCARFVRRIVIGVHLGIEICHAQRIGQVAFVVLQDHRDVVDGEAHFSKVVFEILKRLEIFSHLVGIGIRDEDHAIDTLQH